MSCGLRADKRADFVQIGARRPSGRPGARWLRVNREPLSTERPGPTRVAPADPGGLLPRPRALDLAPSGWRAGAAHYPMAQRRSTTAWRIHPWPDVLWWTRPKLPAVSRTLSTAVLPAALRQISRSVRRVWKAADRPMEHRSAVRGDAASLVRPFVDGASGDDRSHTYRERPAGGEIRQARGAGAGIG